MTARRPSMKRAGVTMTGRQWDTVHRLEADGWLILSVDPAQWTASQVAEVRRRLAAVPSRECTGIAATWCPVHGDCACDHQVPADDPLCPLHGPTSDHAGWTDG